MNLEQRIDALIRPTVEGMGFRLVQATFVDGNKRRTLQIMIERPENTGITVDDCAAISHALSALLDVHDPISGEYHLEVTSPGIDRPLITAEDFRRFSGFDIKAETTAPIAGRKRYKGRLLGISEDDIVSIEIDGTTYPVPLQKIAHAKLILNDALIKAYQQGLVTH